MLHPVLVLQNILRADDNLVNDYFALRAGDLRAQSEAQFDQISHVSKDDLLESVWWQLAQVPRIVPSFRRPSYPG